MRPAPVLLVLAATACLAACARPPQAAIDAARVALAGARADADVVTYAPDALRAADDAAAALEAAVGAQERKPSLLRRYDEVAARAADLSAAAGRAVGEAADAKAQVARDAAALADAAATAITELETRIWAARRVPRMKLDVVAEVARLPAQMRAALEEARRDIAAGAYAVAKAKLLAAKVRIDDAVETLVEQTRIARSR